MKFDLFGRQIEIKREMLIILALIIVLLCCIAGFIFLSGDSDIIIEEYHADSEGQTDREPAGDEGYTGKSASGGESDAVKNPAVENTAGEKEYIKVYVVGCVNKPGIVTIEKGQMLYDAVEKAGGLTKDADPESINMVYELNENIMVYIKPAIEAESPSEGGEGAESGQKGNLTEGGSETDMTESNAGRGVLLIKNGGSGAKLTHGGTKDVNGGGAGNSLVNINTAGVDELNTLPGVGEATAKAIISFREKNGPFSKIEDIMQVPGIKQGRFEKIKDFITVE